jgi:hypothetical protein
MHALFAFLSSTQVAIVLIAGALVFGLCWSRRRE